MVCFALLLAFVAVIPSFADYSYRVEVYINGIKVHFPDQRPFIDTNTNRTYVPLRFVSEALGAQVNWDGASKTAIVIRDGKHIEMQIGSNTPLVNGEPVALDAPALLTNMRTVVPLRFVSEVLGAQVAWDPPRVLITDPNATYEDITLPGEESVAAPFVADGKTVNKFPVLVHYGKPLAESNYQEVTVNDLPHKVGRHIVYGLCMDYGAGPSERYHDVLRIEQYESQGVGANVAYMKNNTVLGTSLGVVLGPNGHPVIGGPSHFELEYYSRKGAINEATHILIYSNTGDGTEVLAIKNPF